MESQLFINGVELKQSNHWCL